MNTATHAILRQEIRSSDNAKCARFNRLINALMGEYETPEPPMELWPPYTAPSVEIDPQTGQLETYAQYSARCAAPSEDTNMICTALGGLEQIAHYEPGVSNQIRNSLIAQLGVTYEIADSAIIAWCHLPTGEYGWSIDLPNGECFYYVDGRLVTPEPPIVTEPRLSSAHIAELRLQLEHFTRDVEMAMAALDIDRCIRSSLFALAISKILA